MISKDEALALLHRNMQSINLRRHSYAVAAAMKALARHFDENEDIWEVVGLLHDADYEKHPDKHPGEILKQLEDLGVSKEVIGAIHAHAWGFNGFDKEPQGNLEWSLYCCDELTGLIVAVTLIRPEKKISSVTVENILSKWNKKEFAKGVNRDQIALCEEKLDIKLSDFIEITLKAMQGISSDLGL